MFVVRELKILYLKRKFTSVKDFNGYLTYLHVKQNMESILLQIKEVENIDTGKI